MSAAGSRALWRSFRRRRWAAIVTVVRYRVSAGNTFMAAAASTEAFAAVGDPGSTAAIVAPFGSALTGGQVVAGSNPVSPTETGLDMVI